MSPGLSGAKSENSAAQGNAQSIHHLLLANKVDCDCSWLTRVSDQTLPMTYVLFGALSASVAFPDVETFRETRRSP